MSKSHLYALYVSVALLIVPLSLFAQSYPSASPKMYVIAADGSESAEEGFDGNAPMHARFEACPVELGDYEALYEWRFTKMDAAEPFLVRYDEVTDYTFTESGSFTVKLYATFQRNGETIEWEADNAFSINISESFLEVPNAFTPNNDGTNDTFHVKEGYRSIVEFHAQVFNRWGKKLYEWHDPAGGWDGTVGGNGGTEAPDGAYYLTVEARGADGRHYHFKKVINLLRTYHEVTGETGQ